MACIPSRQWWVAEDQNIWLTYCSACVQSLVMLKILSIRINKICQSIWLTCCTACVRSFIRLKILSIGNNKICQNVWLTYCSTCVWSLVKLSFLSIGNNKIPILYIIWLPLKEAAFISQSRKLPCITSNGTNALVMMVIAFHYF